MHFGHLAVASVLIQAGASITLEDSKSRTPVDLLSGPVLQAVGEEDSSGIICSSRMTYALLNVQLTFELTRASFVPI